MPHRLKTCRCNNPSRIEFIARDTETLDKVFIHCCQPFNHYIASPLSNDWPCAFHPTPQVRYDLKQVPEIAGSIFMHFKGGVYRVVCVAYMVDALELAVVYRSCDRIDESPWIRPYDTGDSPWLGLAGGNTRERFTRQRE